MGDVQVATDNQVRFGVGKSTGDVGLKSPPFPFEISEKKVIHIGLSKPEVGISAPVDDVRNIRLMNDETFVRWMARRIDDEWIPTQSEAKAIVCRSIEIVQQWWSPDRQAKLPWPAEYAHKRTISNTVHDGIETGYLDPVATSAKLGKIKPDEDSGRHGLNIVPELTRRMSEDDREALGEFILKSFKSFTRVGDDMGWMCLAVVGKTVNVDGKIGRIGPALRDFYNDWVRSRTTDDYFMSGELFLDALRAHHLMPVLFRELLTRDCHTQDERIRLFSEILHKQAGSMYDVDPKQNDERAVQHFPSQLNELRKALRAESLGGEERSALEDTMRGLLGLPEGAKVYEALGKLYESIKFEEYPVSLTIQNDRVDFMSKLLTRFGIRQQSRILELGSGTGWLLAGLRNKHMFANIRGMDSSARNVKVAQETYGYGLFVSGVWDDIPNTDRYKILDAIISDGRSFPHTEDLYNFEKVIREVHEHLRDDGIFTFDMPDPRRGSYASGVSELRGLMAHLGLSQGSIHTAWYIVDSPDGQSFYNRFVPPPEFVVELLENVGFELQQITSQPIPNGHDDMDLTYVFRKKDKPWSYRDNSRRFKQWQKNYNARVDAVKKAFVSGNPAPREFKP